MAMVVWQYWLRKYNYSFGYRQSQHDIYMAKGSVLATVSSCLWNNPSWQVRQFAIALQPRKHSVHWDVWNKCSIEAIFVLFCQKYIRFCRIAFAAYTAANANFLIFPPHLFCFCNCPIEEKFSWSNFDETYYSILFHFCFEAQSIACVGFNECWH